MAWARSSPAWVLSTNPRTPAWTASVTRRSCSRAVSITTWVPGHASTIWRAASMPFRSGIMMSSTATFGSCCRVSSTAVLPSEAARLSKSRYLSGLQCHKQLWWRVHEPEAPELSPSPGEQNRFAQGREVGEHARGHVPGGELIDLPYYQYDNKVAATREAL